MIVAQGACIARNPMLSIRQCLRVLSKRKLLCVLSGRAANCWYRNWDYRFCWIRDSSFTIYILLRMGFTEEADSYMDFISDRFRKSRSPEGALPIMFTIRGETDIPELELS